MNNKILFLLLTVTVIFASCSKDDDVGSEPIATKEGAPMQLMIVFAPGQLGDKGYSDQLLKGASLIDSYYEYMGKDSIDVQFISTNYFEDLKDMVIDWAKNADNPFAEIQFDRRLLVLAEPYMADWLKELNDVLRPQDEVLLMKVNADDVEKAVSTSGLGNRLHGLNIPASESARKYCKYIRKSKEIFGSEDNEISLENIPFFRLYDPAIYDYNDSIYEVMKEELADIGSLEVRYIDTSIGSLFTKDFKMSLMQNAYKFGQDMYTLFFENKYFCLVDLQGANVGFDYFLLGLQRDNSFITLVIDSEPNYSCPNRFYVKREFSTALLNWTFQWKLNEVGGMPRMTSWPNFCTDDIPY